MIRDMSKLTAPRSGSPERSRLITREVVSPLGCSHSARPEADVRVLIPGGDHWSVIVSESVTWDPAAGAKMVNGTGSVTNEFGALTWSRRESEIV
jgi:hypothetical protein